MYEGNKNCCKNEEYLTFKITHILLIISSFITTITYSIAEDHLKEENNLFVGWCLGSGVFSLTYGIFCLYIDFKRNVYFQRNHVTFLLFDFLIIFLLFSISVSGSVLWKNGDNYGKNSFDTGNIFSWISLVIIIVITYQDYKQNEESL